MNNLVKISLAILLSAVLNITVFAQFDGQSISRSLETLKNNNEVEVAVQVMKSNLTDYYPSEITASIKSAYPAVPEDKTIRVLPYVREHQITEGKEFERVKTVAGKLLKFMNLQDRVRVIYFDSEVPVTAFTYPFALCVSSAAANLLTDEELDAEMSHEIMHLIFYPNFKAAIENNNLKELRAIELLCDGGAISILEARGRNSENLISGLEKMQSLLQKVNNDADDGLKHPTLKQRRSFYKQLTQRFNLATNRAAK